MNSRTVSCSGSLSCRDAVTNGGVTTEDVFIKAIEVIGEGEFFIARWTRFSISGIGVTRAVRSRVTLKRLGILFGIVIWAFLWFWPMSSLLIGDPISGIDYLLNNEESMTVVFYFGVGVGLLVTYGILTEFRG